MSFAAVNRKPPSPRPDVEREDVWVPKPQPPVPRWKKLPSGQWIRTDIVEEKP